MRDILARTRRILKPPPRTVEIPRDLAPPSGLTYDHPLWAGHQALWDVSATGEITLAAVPCAAALLGSPGYRAAFANVVYPAGALGGLESIDDLHRAAAEIGELRGAPRPAADTLASFWDVLHAERNSFAAVPVPRALARAQDLLFNTVIVYPTLLPRPALISFFLPIFVDPDSAVVAMVPARYWGDDFARLWIESAISLES